MFGNDWDSVLSDVVSEKWFIDMIDSVRKEYNSIKSVNDLTF